MESLSGFLPAIVTPLSSARKLDVPSLKRLIKHMFDKGAHGLYVGGNTGEGYVLDPDVRKTLAEVCITECKNAKKAAVIHVGHPRTSVAIDLARHAKEAGATAVSSMPPFIGSVKFSDVEFFYQELAKISAPTPVIAYHIPSVTKMQMTTSELCTLLDIEGVVGFKFTDSDLYKLERTLAARPDAIIFHGMSTVQVPALLYGAVGGITGGGGNLTPELMVSIVNAVEVGNVKDAMVMQRSFNSVQGMLYGPFASKMVATFKAILVWQGVISCAVMVQDQHLSPAEILSLKTTVSGIPELKDFLPNLEADIYTELAA